MRWMTDSLDAPPFSSDSVRALVACAPALRCLVLVCVLAMMASAPRAKAQDVRMGIRVGPTFGFLSDSAVPFASNNEAINANPRLDFHVGAHVILPLTNRLALQPELLYVQKGAHFSRPAAESYAVERYQLSYVQGALLARRDLSLPSPLSIHVVAGPSVDRALNGLVQRNFQTAEVNSRDRVDLLETERLRQWDVGTLLGVGLGYPTGPSSRVALEVRYNPGFRSVFARPSGANDPFPLPGSPPLRHDVITASLSYTLPPTSR